MAPDAVPSGDVDVDPFTATAPPPPPPPPPSPSPDLRRPPGPRCATPRTGDPNEGYGSGGVGPEGSILFPPSQGEASSSKPLSAFLFPAPRVPVSAAAAPQEEGGRGGRGGRATNLTLQRTARIREGYRDWRALGAAHPLLRVRKPMLPPLPLPSGPLAAVESELSTPGDTSSVGYSTPLEEVSPVGGEQATNQSPPPPPPPSPV